MDYKEKYNAALDRAKKVHRYSSDLAEIKRMEDIFPELKESEDERIINCIGMCLTDVDEQRFKDYDTTLKDCLDWLKKQGEKKVSYTTTVETGDGGINALVTRDIEIPFGAKDSELQEATYYIPQGYYAKIESDKVVIKKGEQKTAWSEDDNKWIESLIQTFEDGYFEGFNQLKSYGVIDWLKSLKQRIGG